MPRGGTCAPRGVRPRQGIVCSSGEASAWPSLSGIACRSPRAASRRPMGYSPRTPVRVTAYAIAHIRVLQPDVHPPPHALRVLAARRAEQDPRPRRACEGDGAGRPRDHRPRQPLRRDPVLRGGAQARGEANPRHRGVCRAGQPLQPRRHGPLAVPPHAARHQRGGLPQPAQALDGVAPRGVLLQAAHGPRAARGPQRRADRALRLPLWRGDVRAPRGARAGRDERRGLVPRMSSRAATTSRCRSTGWRSSVR